MTATPPGRRLPKVIAGGKPLKTDLRRDSSETARRLRVAGRGEEDGSSRADRLEASRLLIEEARKERGS